MTLPLRLYLAQRRKDINQEIQRLNAELAEVDKAESALGAEQSDTNWSEVLKDPAPQRRRFNKSIKDMVIEILASSLAPMVATELLSVIKGKYGVDLERTSLSPQLSRLKSDGYIAAENNSWFLTPAGRQAFNESDY